LARKPSRPAGPVWPGDGEGPPRRRAGGDPPAQRR